MHDIGDAHQQGNDEQLVGELDKIKYASYLERGQMQGRPAAYVSRIDSSIDLQ